MTLFKLYNQISPGPLNGGVLQRIKVGNGEEYSLVVCIYIHTFGRLMHAVPFQRRPPLSCHFTAVIVRRFPSNLNDCDNIRRSGQADIDRKYLVMDCFNHMLY